MLLPLVVALGSVQPSFANGIHVTTLADKIGGGGGCSLKEAIYSSTLHDTFDGAHGMAIDSTDPDHFITTHCELGSGSDTIILPTGYPLPTFFMASDTIPDAYNPYGRTATPIINSHITIEGYGATLQWAGTGNVRLFAVGPATIKTPNGTSSGTGSLTLINVHITGFAASGGNGADGGGGGLGAGGAIYVHSGNLNIQNCTFDNNTAIGGNGDVLGDGVDGYNPALGGGSGGGGGLGGDGGNDIGALGSGNSGGGGGGSRGNGGLGLGAGAGGGGTVNDGGSTAYLTTDEGAGGYLCGGDGGGTNSNGDGHSGDNARCPGGGGGGSGGFTSALFSGPNGGNGAYGGGGGGGNNQGGNGGFGGGGGAGRGGGLGTGGGGNGGFGGGGGASGEGSGGGAGGAFGGDAHDGGGGGGALGGAIFSDDGILVIENSTFTKNDVSEGAGGGIALGFLPNGPGNNGAEAGTIFAVEGSVTVIDSTISGNHGDSAGLVVYGDGVATSLTLDNTIISGNGMNECYVEGTASATGVGNLITSNGSGGTLRPCPGVVVTADPQLGPLQLNSPGLTPTMAISITSSAFNAADASTSLSTDQRGVDRPQDGGYDIGAFEACPPPRVFGEITCLNLVNAPPANTQTLNMAASPAGTGATQPPVGANTVLAGALVSLQATANPGYSFVNWTGSVTNPASPSTTILMTANEVSVTANFALCDCEVGGEFGVVRGGYVYNFGTSRYSQTITLQNNSPLAITGPISLILDSLSSNAILLNATGYTDTLLPPNGSPYINASVTLAPGQSVSLTLTFANPTKKPINYNTRVVTGAGAR